MNVLANVTIDLQRPVYTTVYATQGDRLTRKIVAQLTSEGVAWNVPVGTQVMIWYSKPDGTTGMYDTDENGDPAYTISGSSITFVIARQALAVSGNVAMQIRLYNADEEILTTFAFVLTVIPGINDADIVSGDYYNLMTATLAQMAGEVNDFYAAMQAGYGSPLVAATAADMTDHTKVYVYVGSETGYTSGDWYYWNGSAWADGGVYNSAAVSLDDTLTSTTKAAQAAAVGAAIDAAESDLNDLEDLCSAETGVRIVEFVAGGYIPTTSTVVDPTNITTSSSYAYCVVTCVAGDNFTVTAGGGSSSKRPWTFIDDENNVIDQAGVNSVTNSILIAPLGATKLVLNSASSYNPYCHKGISRITALETSLNYSNRIIGEEIGLTPCTDWKPGAIRTDSGTIDIADVRNNNGYLHLVVPCVPGDVFTVHIEQASASARPYAIVDANGVKLAAAAQNTVDASIIIPADAAYLICNVRIDTGRGIHDVSKGTGEIDVLIDKTSQLEDAIADITGITEYTFTDGRIRTDLGTVDVSSVQAATNWYHCVVDCEKGDIFNIYVPNATSTWRPWTFIDTSGTVISQASVNKVNTRLTAPTNAAKLVCNSYGSSATLTTGIDRLSEWKEYDRYKNLLGIFRVIGVVGDSLSSGQGRINDLDHYHDFYEYSWPQQIKRILGNEVYNFTKSGLSTVTWLTDSMGWALASDGNHNAQCYIIGLGANDADHIESDPTYLGTESDVHVDDYTQNPNTYYGNYGRIISMLKTIEPRAVFFVLPNPVYGGTAQVREQMNAAVEYMATAFENVYFVPLDTSLYASGYISANKVKSHYTPGAYMYMANYLMGVISKVIYDNPSDFFFVNLIGTEYATPDMT